MAKTYNAYSDPRKTAYFDVVEAKMSGDTIELTGEVEGSASFDGTGSVTVTATLNKSKLAEAIGLVHRETPSLSIPFNESGRLEHGVGTEYVAGLPVYGVDFSRSTSCYYINKSGLTEYADVDEIAIGKDGAILHGAVTNLCLSSGDVTDETYWTLNTHVEYGDTDTGLGVDLQYVVPNTVVTSSHFLRQQSITLSSQEATATVFFKKNSDFSCRLYIRDGDNSNRVTQNFTMDDLLVGPYQETGGSTLDSFEVESLGDYARVKLRVTFSSEADISNVHILIYLLQRDGYTETSLPDYPGDGVTGAYIGGVELLDGHYDLDTYIPTTSSASTITATSCTVPVNGNLPAGGSFTIVCGAKIPDTGSIPFKVGNSEKMVLWRFSSGASVVFRLSDGSNTIAMIIKDSGLGVGLDGYTISYDGTNLYGYLNGELVQTVDASGINWENVYSSEDLIYFGAARGTDYSVSVKDFKILPYCASPEEVASWGAPK